MRKTQWKKMLLAAMLGLAVGMTSTIPVQASGINVIKVDKKYSVHGGFTEGLAIIQTSDCKEGYIDTSGKVVVPCQYDNAGVLYDGYARVCKDGKYGFIDRNGTEVVPCEYEDAAERIRGLFFVKKDGKWLFLNTKGEKIASANQYISIGMFTDGLAKVYTTKGCGIINKEGKEIIPCKYNDIDYSDGIFIVTNKTGKKGCFDKNGKKLLSCTYEIIHKFSDGMSVIVKNGKYGYTDKNGKIVVPCQYMNASDFSEGVAPVMKNNKLLLINKKGKTIATVKIKNFIFGGVHFSEGLLSESVVLDNNVTKEVAIKSIRRVTSLSKQNMLIFGIFQMALPLYKVKITNGD